VPRLHIEHYNRALRNGGNEACLETAVEAVDLHGVQNALYRAPRMTRYRDAGVWLESLAFSDYESFRDRYHGVTPSTPPTRLKKKHFNYLSAPPEEWQYRRENLKIIDHLVAKGVNPLRPYATSDMLPDQKALCAAEYMFCIDTEDTNLHPKSQVVLHALDRAPGFRPRFNAMMAAVDQEHSGSEVEYARVGLSCHIHALGTHVGTRLMAPTTPLEQRVAAKLGRENRPFWLYPLHDWDITAIPPPVEPRSYGLKESKRGQPRLG